MKGIKLIPLDQRGSVVIIDAEDWEKIRHIKWHKNDSGYAVWRGIKNGVKRTIRMHRVINDTPDGLVTDHINRNRLDNRKSNLRSVTQKENMQNIEHGLGVWHQRQTNRWVVEVYKKHIGCFGSEELALQIATMVYDGELPLDRISEHTYTPYCKRGHNKEIVGTYGRDCKECVKDNQLRYYERKKQWQVNQTKSG